jgi:folate-binding protein YgfZ
MIALDYLSVARFQGPDAGEFLQAQVSADIAVLEPGEATFACYCTPRGQVIGLLLVCRQDEGYLVATAAALLPRILTRLKMFVLRSRVEFSAQPGIAVCGIEPQEDIPAPGVFQAGGLPLRYLFPENAGEANDRTERFKALEILNRVTWLGSETAEKFIPQMLGFDQIGAVSYTKGCYPGQEIVARTRYLGKVKRKPVIVQTREELLVQPTDRVELRREDAWSAGTVIDSVAIDGAGTLCFIVAPEEPGDAPDELRYQDRSYRCATI